MNMNGPDWQNIAITSRDGITEFRFHTDDGPLVWSAVAHRDLTEAFSWVQTQLETKVLILTGTGDTFCTELDVTEFAKLPWDYIWWEGRRLLRNLNDIDIPIIGVVNGPAHVHSEIPVMGDIVLAAEHAEFADRAHFPIRDTVPGDGVNLVWGELLGSTRSRYWMLTGAVISAHEGHRIGFVNEVLPAAELLSRAWELATDLARRSVPVLRYAKAALSIGFRRNFNEGLSHGLAVEGSAYWSRGGMKSERVSAADES